MTPEERAKEIANKISFEAGAHHTSWFCATAKEWIATAIREAIAEEREACARVADKYWGGGMPEDAIGESMLNASHDIATAIRSRSKEG